MKSLFILLTLLSSSIAFSNDDLSPEKWEARLNLYELEQQRLFETNFDPKKIHQTNRQVIRDIEQIELNQDSKRVTALSEKELRKLLNYAIHHPVAGLKALNKYDPNGEIGFCFGRALFIHLELLRRGVDKESIKKVFVVGEMLEVDPVTNKQTVWQFHVATSVKGTDGQWWVIDPSYGLFELRDWYRYMKKMAVQGRISVFNTPLSKIGPSAWEYNTKPGGLMDPYYNNYFKDLFASFKQAPVVKDYRKSCQSVVQN